MTTPSIQIAQIVPDSLEKTVLGGLYDDILGIIGSTGTLLPVGDSLHSPTSTTFKTLGVEQRTFTYSEDPAGFDVPQGKQGIVPILTFNGSDEEADTPDLGYFSRGDLAFTMGAMIRLTTGGSGTRTILAKYASSAAEWLLVINSSGKIQVTCSDQSAGVDSTRVSDAAISEDVWHLVIATRPAAGTGTTAMDNVIISVDDAVVASTATSSSSYIGMENLSGVVHLGQYLSGNFFAGSMALPFFVQGVVTPDEKLRIWDLARRAMGL
jgi:hypothetical protein